MGGAHRVAGSQRISKQMAVLEVVPRPVVRAEATLNTDFTPFVSVRFDASLLLETIKARGVRGWNLLHGRMAKAGITVRTDPSAAISPIFADLDLSGMQLGGQNLDGIDLRYCFMARAAFCNCSLQRARFQNVAKVTFEGADLRAARFEQSNLTGTTFLNANLHGAQFMEPFYYKGKPPRGLPKATLDSCREELLP
jgi:uncharacterized protein YjbI with pentapeptide repeats